MLSLLLGRSAMAYPLTLWCASAGPTAGAEYVLCGQHESLWKDQAIEAIQSIDGVRDDDWPTRRGAACLEGDRSERSACMKTLVDEQYKRLAHQLAEHTGATGSAALHHDKVKPVWPLLTWDGPEGTLRMLPERDGSVYVELTTAGAGGTCAFRRGGFRWKNDYLLELDTADVAVQLRFGVMQDHPKSNPKNLEERFLSATVVNSSVTKGAAQLCETHDGLDAIFHLRPSTLPPPRPAPRADSLVVKYRYPYFQGHAFAAADNINLREAPSRIGEVVAKIPFATPITIIAADRVEKIGAREDRWYKVRVELEQGEVEGFVFASTLTPARLRHDFDADGTEELLVAAYNSAGMLVLRMRDADDTTAPVAWGRFGHVEVVEGHRFDSEVQVELIGASKAGVPLLYFALPREETPDDPMGDDVGLRLAHQYYHFVLAAQPEGEAQAFAKTAGGRLDFDLACEARLEAYTFEADTGRLLLNERRVCQMMDGGASSTKYRSTYQLKNGRYEQVGTTEDLGTEHGQFK